MSHGLGSCQAADWRPHQSTSAALLAVLVAGGIYVLSLGGDPERLPVHAIASMCAADLPCPSRGLTRAFVCLARGNVEGARKYNVYAPRLFAVLILLGVFRALALLRCSPAERRQRLVADIIVSPMLFIWVLWPFITRSFS